MIETPPIKMIKSKFKRGGSIIYNNNKNSKAFNLEQKCGPFQDRVQLTQCAVKDWFTVLLRESRQSLLLPA